MSKQLTVRELIQVLQGLPQDLPVEIGMNQEYQSQLTAEDLNVESYFETDRGNYLHIGD
jgi:hypothetical protein